MITRDIYFEVDWRGLKEEERMPAAKITTSKMLFLDMKTIFISFMQKQMLIDAFIFRKHNEKCTGESSCYYLS